MDQENIESQSPNYQRLFKSIKSNLRERSGLLAKRVLLAGWPALIVIAIISIINDYDISTDSPAFEKYMIFLIFFSPFALLYVFLLTHIFSIEKFLWIDSHCDKKNLTPKESFKISRKLFWPALLIRLRVFVQYYIPPILIYILACFATFFLFDENIGIIGRLSSLIFPFIIGPLILYFYFLYVKIKLRYIWFLFLDNYGKEQLSHGSLLKEMYRLNEINKSESFKKSLVITLGADFLQNVAQIPIGFGLRKGFGLFGKGGRVIGDVASAYSNSITSEMASLSKIAANYVLYRFSREQLYKEPQVVNTHVYSLLEK